MNERPRFGIPSTPPLDLDAIDELGDREGFVERQALLTPPKRRRGTKEQLHNFTMRLAIKDAEKFIRWCEEERIAYREGFAKLVGLLDPTGQGR